jgi:hypothetical protein
MANSQFEYFEICTLQFAFLRVCLNSVREICVNDWLRLDQFFLTDAETNRLAVAQHPEWRAERSLRNFLSFAASVLFRRSLS